MRPITMGWPWSNASRSGTGLSEARPENRVRENHEIVQLYDEHAPGLLHFALQTTGSGEAAREALQEAFAALVGQVRVGAWPADPKVFLYQAITDFLRLRAVHAEAPSDPEAPTSEQPDFDAPLRAAEVRRRLNRLASPRELEMLRLRAEGFSYFEIAGVLSVNPGTVASTLARAFRKIRKAFEGELP